MGRCRPGAADRFGVVQDCSYTGRLTLSFDMQSLEAQSDRDKFQSIVPQMLSTIAHVLNAGEETAAQEALEMFIEV